MNSRLFVDPGLPSHRYATQSDKLPVFCHSFFWALLQANSLSRFFSVVDVWRISCSFGHGREPLFICEVGLSVAPRSHTVAVRARVENYAVGLTPGCRLQISGRASGTAMRREHLGHAAGCHPDRLKLGG